jgi:hypothetical protein
MCKHVPRFVCRILMSPLLSFLNMLPLDAEQFGKRTQYMARKAMSSDMLLHRKKHVCPKRLVEQRDEVRLISRHGLIRLPVHLNRP